MQATSAEGVRDVISIKGDCFGGRGGGCFVVVVFFWFVGCFFYI